MKEFKQVLQKIKKDNYDFTTVDKVDLLEQCLQQIGAQDEELRDGLIYPVLAHLLHDDHFEQEFLLDLTKRLLSKEFLFFDIDNDVEYSILIRSFTMLQLAILALVHRKKGLFNQSQYNELFTSVIDYLRLEEDYRGYEDEVGFIHSVAHAADTLNELCQAKEANDLLYRRVFDTINLVVDQGRIQFTNDEDERLVNVMETIIKTKTLENEYLLQYIDLFADYKRPKTYPQIYHNNRNVKCLLRSLYFRFIDQDDYTFLTDKIKSVLAEKVKLR